MHINIKNIVISLVIILLLAMSFNIILNISRNEYLKKVIKSDSQEMLKDYSVYNDISIVLNKYFEAIKNSDYTKLNDMSLFYARKTNNDYDKLKDSIQLSDNYKLDVVNVYKLDKNIYRCVVNIKSINGTTNKYTICLKIDSDNKYFRILDFIV